MLRIRFKIRADDYRPINWPIKHPYWCTGYDSDDSAIMITYADEEAYVNQNWPEATDMEIQEVEGYEFANRLPKPKWFDD